MKGFAGVLLAAVIPLLKRKKRAEAKNKQDPSNNSTGGGSKESTGLTAVTLRQPYIGPLHCCIVLQSESERNTSSAASAASQT